MLLKTLLVFLFCTNSSNICSQPLTWLRNYNGPFNSSDIGNDICESTPGTYFIAGTSSNSAYILRINEFGDTLWSKLISNVSQALCITPSGDGGCVLSGDVISQLPNPFTIKLDSNGNIVWYKHYPPYSFSQTRDIDKTSDGGYIACGRIGNFNANIFKINSNGDLVWQRNFSGLNSGLISFTGIKETKDGNFIVVGTDFSISPQKAILFKISAVGDTIWKKYLSIDNRQTFANSIQLYGEDSYALGGSVQDTGIFNQKLKPYLMKVNLIGEIISYNIFPSGNFCEGNQDMVFDGVNFIFTTLKLTGPNCNDSLIVRLIKTDSIGNQLNAKELASTNDIQINKILISNNNYLFTGVIEDSSTIFENILALKTDTSFNYKMVGINQISANVPERFILDQNYPNPFNPSTKIKFSIPVKAKVKLIVLDQLGRTIYNLVDEELSPGTYEYDFRGNSLSSGVYYYRLEAGQFVETRRMVLVK